VAALVYCASSNVWNTFCEESEQIRDDPKLIAENKEFGITVFLMYEEEQGKPAIVVYADDDPIFAEVANDSVECEDVCQRAYGYTYEEKLFEKFLENDAEIEIDFPEEENDEEGDIEDREAELDACIEDFLSDILGDPIEDFVGTKEVSELIEDVKDHFLEYLARKWNVPIYRPMILENDDGVEFFEKFPYEKLAFEDPDNPIFQRKK